MFLSYFVLAMITDELDRLRLVMPPLLFFVLETPFTKLAHTIFPTAVANGIIAGAFTFYVFYDCFHYACVSFPFPFCTWINDEAVCTIQNSRNTLRI